MPAILQNEAAFVFNQHSNYVIEVDFQAGRAKETKMRQYNVSKFHVLSGFYRAIPE